MNHKYNYTSVDRIFAKFSRDLRGTDLHESDIIEWIGEALEFLKLPEIQEEAVAFLEIKNYQAELPQGFQSMIQVARNNRWTSSDPTCIKDIVSCDIDNTETVDFKCLCQMNFDNMVFTDCEGNIINKEYDVAYYRPKFDLKWEYELWTGSRYYQTHYSPVRLANSSFFNTVVCRENNPNLKRLYNSTSDEYTLIEGYPTRQIRVNFREGQIAISYLRNAIDEKTGYPLIPDSIEHITAIGYYIKWKMSERLRWNGREGFATEAQDAEAKWLKYVRQAINKTKMPSGIDQYQNLMEQSLYLIPRTRKYYGFFGNLGREESRRFNNLNYRYGR